MPQSVVWIVGAGFSKALGGPLLPDLLAPHKLGEVRARYGPAAYPLLHGPAVTIAHALYNYGVSFEYGRLRKWDVLNSGGRFWEDAERFLDRLETLSEIARQNRSPTAEPQPTSEPPKQWIDSEIDFIADRLNLLPAPSVGEVSSAACRLVAAECSLFLEDSETEEEAFQPFIEWATHLERTDRIITFNYDLVLERLNDAGKPIHVVLPATADLPDKPSAFKLHGSVNWRRWQSGTDPRSFATAEDTALLRPDEEVVMATPGPRKMRLCKEAPFNALWTRAMKAIQQADAIVFVGYRFPPTDSFSRIQLLDAIRCNESRLLAVHTVLGPNNKDAGRLEELIRFALERDGRREEIDFRQVVHSPAELQYSLRSLPLYAQDFFSIVRRQDLLHEPSR